VTISARHLLALAPRRKPPGKRSPLSSAMPCWG
jgi:hypothetical protein